MEEGESKRDPYNACLVVLNSAKKKNQKQVYKVLKYHKDDGEKMENILHEYNFSKNVRRNIDNIEIRIDDFMRMTIVKKINRSPKIFLKLLNVLAFAP